MDVLRSLEFLSAFPQHSISHLLNNPFPNRGIIIVKKCLNRKEPEGERKFKKKSVQFIVSCNGAL